MKLFVVVAWAMIASTVGEDGVNGRIINGRNATLGQYPYQVSIQEDNYQHICGGFLITPTYVVTAAHCIFDRFIRVVAGIVDLSGNTTEARKYRQETQVVQSIRHPNYNKTSALHDIGLLKLASPMKLNAAVNLIRLPKFGSRPTGLGVLSGWGLTSNNGDVPAPNRLQTVTLPILSTQDCQDSIRALHDKNILSKAYQFDDKAMICTGPLSGGFGGCDGDSGGPLAQNGTVYGIVSWSARPCARLASPTVFAKVENYLDFIKLNVPDLPAN